MTQGSERDFLVNMCSPCHCRQLHHINPFILGFMMQNIFLPGLIVDRLHSKQLFSLKCNDFAKIILGFHLESKTFFKDARKVCKKRKKILLHYLAVG